MSNNNYTKPCQGAYACLSNPEAGLPTFQSWGHAGIYRNGANAEHFYATEGDLIVKVIGRVVRKKELKAIPFIPGKTYTAVLGSNYRFLSYYEYDGKTYALWEGVAYNNVYRTRADGKNITGGAIFIQQETTEIDNGKLIVEYDKE